MPEEQIKQAVGRHEPLWDLQTHKAILREYKRRTRNYRGRVNNQFTGLVKCGICGASMWRQGNGPRQHRHIWRCSSTGTAAGHCNFLHDILVRKVAEQLAEIREAGNNAAPIETEASSYDIKRVEELQSQLTRLEDAYLIGEWDLQRYTERKRKIEQQLAEYQEDIKEHLRKAEDRRAWSATVEDMAGIDFQKWITVTPANEVNRALHVLLREICVTPDEVVLKPRF